MNKELLELKQKKEELHGKIARAKNIEELNGYQAELDAIINQENFIIQRDQMAAQLNQNKNMGKSVAVPGKAPAEEEDRFDSLEYRNAFRNYVTSGDINAIPIEYRGNEVTKTTDVGAVIPTTIMNRIIDKLEATGMILKEVTRTALKGGVSYPVSAVKPTAKWVAEGASADKEKKTVTDITFTYHKLSCRVAISLETSVTTLAVFESTMVANITEAMVKAIEAAIIDGTGSGQPKGILKETPNEGQDIEVDPAVGITYADVVKAEGALPLAYENGAVWCMTKKTFMGFIGQVDSQKQPIARVNYGLSGQPERFINGRRVILNDYMKTLTPESTQDDIVAFLFNFKDYAINTNYNMGIKRYEDNETDDQVMKAVMLVDGKVLDKGSLVILSVKGE